MTPYPFHLSPDRLKVELLSQYDKDVVFRVNKFEKMRPVGSSANVWSSTIAPGKK